MCLPLQDGHTPRPLQLAIGRAGHPWPRPARQPMGTPRVPMAAEPGSAGPRRRTSAGTVCRERVRIQSRGCRTRDSRGVPPRRAPARAARRGRATRASSRGSRRRSCGTVSSRGGDARSGVPARSRHEAGGGAATGNSVIPACSWCWNSSVFKRFVATDGHVASVPEAGYAILGLLLHRQLSRNRIPA